MNLLLLLFKIKKKTFQKQFQGLGRARGNILCKFGCTDREIGGYRSSVGKQSNLRFEMQFYNLRVRIANKMFKN